MTTFYGKDLEAARPHDEESRARFRDLGDQRGVAGCLYRLANLEYLQGNDAASRALPLQSLRIRQELGDQRNIADSLFNLGFLAVNNGDCEETRRRFHESLALMRALDDRRGIAFILEGCAQLAAAQSKATRALHLAGAAAALRVHIGSPVPPAARQHFDAGLAPIRFR